MRQLQRRLWAAAKQQPGRRFHALYDRICRSDVLQEAWKRVRRNRGAAGVDGQTLAAVEQHGVERFLEEIQRRAARRQVPTAGGPAPVHPEGRWKAAAAGIPTVRDRVVQMAAKLVLEPIFEADFHAVLVRLSAEAERDAGAGDHRASTANRGCHHVLDADIRDYFGSIDHDEADEAGGATRSRTGGCSSCCGSGSRQGDGGRARVRRVAGTPQGGVISPLLSNIYLHVLDARVDAAQCADLGTLVRYADDFVVMCNTKKDCEEAERRVREHPRAARLELHPDKTRRVELSTGASKGFDFLGCHLRKRMSGADLGEDAQARLLPPALAVDERA